MYILFINILINDEEQLHRLIDRGNQTNNSFL